MDYILNQTLVLKKLNMTQECFCQKSVIILRVSHSHAYKHVVRQKPIQSPVGFPLKREEKYNSRGIFVNMLYYFLRRSSQKRTQ